MAYRGEDLDLRTPQASAAPEVAPPDILVGSPRSRSQISAARSSPIWVDETLLDCCNHAFDVAVAHRAAEVRVEHLVYAMTRVDAAAEILEQRGVRVAALRRESANVIATEIPVGLLNGKTTSRRSEALEDVLRIAASSAYRHQAAASVDDVLTVLLDTSIDLPSAQRLRSLLQRPLQAPSHVEPLPPEPPRERFRQPYYPSEPQRGLGADLASLTSASQAYTQASRLDVLEQTIRSLSSELANERKILSGMLQDLQREIMAQRDETARSSGLSHDKIQGYLADRLQGLEQGLVSTRSSTMSDLSLVQEKIAMLERALVAEMSAARIAINDLAARPAPVVDLSPVSHRLDVIEEAVLSHDIIDRIQAVETSLAYERDRATAADNTFNSNLQAISATLERHPSEITSLVLSPVTERFNGLSYTLENHAAATSNGTAETQRLLADLGNNLVNVSNAVANIGNALANVGNNVSHLGSALDAHVARTENAEQATVQEFGALHDTIGKLASGLNDELGALHDSLAKLNTNQHTLAASIEQQNLDAAQAFATLAARIESLEKTTAKPVAMLETLSGTTTKMHHLMVEKYFRINRLSYWLFGTDDWLAASWPSQSALVADELTLIKRP